MSDYIHLFETQAAHDAVYNGSEYTEPWVGLVTANNTLSYNNPEYKLRSTPLTFEITNDGNIVWKAISSNYVKTIEYKKNNGNWTSITSTTSGVTISVVSGDIVQFRGNNITYGDAYLNEYNYFGGTTAGFKLKGNIMSLINSTNFATLTAFDSESYGTFTYLFYNCIGLTDASNLILPATTLSFGSYQAMFYKCSNLIIAPKLPAAILTSSCYKWMFYNCTNLNNVTCLATNIAASSCLGNWLNNVSSTGTFTKAASMTWWPSGASGIPTGWTVQDAS